jgi:integrase
VLASVTPSVDVKKRKRTVNSKQKQVRTRVTAPSVVTPVDTLSITVNDTTCMERVVVWLDEYKPESTKKNYERYERLFWEWVCNNNIVMKDGLKWPLEPIPPAVVADFLHWCVTSKTPPLKASTMRICASAISSMHVIKGFDTPTRTPLVSVAKRTLGNYFGRQQPVKRRKPYTADMLRLMASHINPQTRVDVRDWAMIILTCILGMRGSEVCALRVRDIWVHSTAEVNGKIEPILYVYIRSSKTDQAGTGTLRVAPASAPSNTPWMCARTWLALWMEMRNKSSEWMFHRCYKHVDDNRDYDNLPIQRATFYHRIIALVEAAGVDPSCYGSHSGRVTFATSGGAANIEERVIKLAGGWKSDSVRVYIRESLERRLEPSRAVHDMASRATNSNIDNIPAGKGGIVE